MAACTSGPPAMAPAGLSLCLLLQSTLLLPSVTSKSSAPHSLENKPFRETPFFPSQQDPQSLNVAPAAYDLALLNDDDLSAFEEETAIKNEPKRSEHKAESTTNKDEDSNTNDVDFPNYYDSDKQNSLNYDSYTPDSYYETEITSNKRKFPEDPIPYKINNNIDSNIEDNRIETATKNALTFNIDKEFRKSDLNYNSKNFNEYENKDKYVSNENALKELNGNADEEYEIVNNNVLKSDDFESLNEGYARGEDYVGVRKKRDTESTSNKTKPRSITGDTVLNIAGAVRDTIGELAPFASPPSPRGAAPAPPAPPSGATRLDAVVIRTAASATPPLLLHTTDTDTDDQLNEGEEEGVVTAEVGARVVLPCDVPAAGAGTRDVTWTRDHEPSSLVAGGEGGELVVRASRGAAGRWRCADKHRLGNITTLRIYERSGGAWLREAGRRGGRGGRLAAGGGAWLPAREGEPLPLACHADGGVPPPVLVWRVSPASALFSYNSTTYRDGVATSWASVLATRGLHNATITCEAKQRKPTFSLGGGDGGGGGDSAERAASVMLQVTFPPTFSISRRPGFGRPLAAGRGATLRCDVSANPAPRAHWTRQDQPLPAALMSSGAGWAEARWESLSRSHAGWYRCVCEWAGTTYSSIGYFLMLAPENDPEANPADSQRCLSGAGPCRTAAAAATTNTAESRPDVNVVHSGAAGAARGWRRVSCGVCGAERARWLLPGAGTSEPARLLPAAPAPAPAAAACHVATYTAPAHEEVWCVAVNDAGGSVAVFPALSPPPPAPPGPPGPAAPPAPAGPPAPPAAPLGPAASPPPAAPRAASKGSSHFVSASLTVLLVITTEYLM